MKTGENSLWQYSEEEQQLAEQIIGLEKTALDKWFNGDSSGYRDLWSEQISHISTASLITV